MWDLLWKIKVIFNKHTKSKTGNFTKAIAVVKCLYIIFPRSALSIICEVFIRTNFNYANIIHENDNNDSFSKKIEDIE